jgi:hypothetical protein
VTYLAVVPDRTRISTVRLPPFSAAWTAPRRSAAPMAFRPPRLEDDIADLEAVLGSGPVVIDESNDHPLGAGFRCDREAELQDVCSLRVLVVCRLIPIDRRAKTAAVAAGVVVPVTRPFFGAMRVAPLPAMGRISSAPPGVHTGNLDNKDLSVGTTLFMPIYAPGALFSVGDAHAAKGQNEVDLAAIETGLSGKFQFIVRTDMKIMWSGGETPTHWIVMGLNPNLEEAMKMAVRKTIPFITQSWRAAFRRPGAPTINPLWLMPTESGIAPAPRRAPRPPPRVSVPVLVMTFSVDPIQPALAPM